MKLKKILFSLVVLFSVHSIAGELKDIYIEVLDIIKLYCKPGQYFNPPNKSLYMTDLDLPTIGQCITDKYDFFNIYIDRTFWKMSSKDIRFELVAHEMTHCLFFRNHVDNSSNFMYYAIRDLTKDQTIQQLIENLNTDCGDKNGK